MKNFGSNTVIYTKPSCPYCIQAKQLLQSRNIQFDEIVIDGTNYTKAQMCEDLGLPLNTVPQIVLKGTFIPGGCTGLMKHFQVV